MNFSTAHSMSKMHLCEICNKGFNSKRGYNHHYKSDHLGEKFECAECGKQFSQKPHLTWHISSVHNNVKHKCDQCGREYSSKTNMYHHIKSVHENKKYPCTHCDYQATQKKDLTRHKPWNNGKEVPRWGVAEILKMSPSTTGRCSRQTADQWERGTATRQPITQICSPGVVKLVYLQSRLGRTCEI